MKRLLLAVLMVLPATTGPAADFHVATDGDDVNPGSAELPWRTVQHAVASVGPGDRILVHQGTYAGARIEISGSPGAYVELQAAPGEAVVLDGPGPANRHGSTLELETWSAPGNVAYWAVEGFEIVGGSRSGIDVRNAHHVLLRGNRVHSSGLTGIFTAFADDLLIEGNESFDNGEHGVYTSNSGDRPLVRGNHLHDNFASGLHMNADLSQGGDGVISEALVEANVIHGNGTGGGAGINMDGVVDSRVINNLLYDEHASGIAVFQQDGAVCSSDNLMANNTVVTAADGRWALVMPDAGCTGNRLLNNVFWSDHSFRGSIAVWSPAPPGLISDHNAVMDRFSTDGGDTVIDLAAWRALGFGGRSLLASPAELFVDPAAGDYHLTAESPAIDAGFALPEVTEDLEGAPRPQGAAHDAGCYEVGGLVFEDGFESGDVSAWSAAVP